MKKIVLFGSGDNSNVILDIINEVKNFKVIGVVDKKENISFKKNKLKYLGNINFFLKNLSKSDKNLLSGELKAFYETALNNKQSMLFEKGEILYFFKYLYNSCFR